MDELSEEDKQSFKQKIEQEKSFSFELDGYCFNLGRSFTLTEEMVKKIE